MSRVREVDVVDDRLTVRLIDGRAISVPVGWFPRLERATEEERRNWGLIGDGEGIHWPDIDEHISVASLLRPEVTIPSREIRERGTGPSGPEVRRRALGGTLQGWDDTRVYFYVDKDDPLRPYSGYCVSHDPELLDRLVEVCRQRMRELDIDDFPPKPGPGVLRPWPPADYFSDTDD